MWLIILAHVSFVLTQITRLTARRTYGRTDSFLVAMPRWHSMQRRKNDDSSPAVDNMEHVSAIH